MSGNFYFETINILEGEEKPLVFEMSATTDISVTRPSTCSTYTSSRGYDITNNIKLDPMIVKFDGILSNVIKTGLISKGVNFTKGLAGVSSTEKLSLYNYITKLDKAWESKEVFKVYYSGTSKEKLKGLDEAYLKDFTINKDVSLGESWEVSIALEQVRRDKTGRVVSVVASEFTPKFAQEEKGTDSTKSATGETRSDGTTLTRVTDRDGKQTLYTLNSDGTKGTKFLSKPEMNEDN